MHDHSFPRKDRLLDAAAYGRVFDAAELRASHKYLLFLATPNTLNHHRLGIIVAKKNVKLSVQRNRFKRIVREVFRNRAPDARGLDVVVMARKGVDALDNKALSSIVRQQWQKLTEKQATVANKASG
jgi:ribonuclease P protein component